MPGSESRREPLPQAREQPNLNAMMILPALLAHEIIGTAPSNLWADRIAVDASIGPVKR